MRSTTETLPPTTATLDLIDADLALVGALIDSGPLPDGRFPEAWASYRAELDGDTDAIDRVLTECWERRGHGSLNGIARWAARDLTDYRREVEVEVAKREARARLAAKETEEVHAEVAAKERQRSLTRGALPRAAKAINEVEADLAKLPTSRHSRAWAREHLEQLAEARALLRRYGPRALNDDVGQKVERRRERIAELQRVLRRIASRSNLRGRPRPLEPEAMLEAAGRFYAYNGRWPTQAEARRHKELPSVTTARRRFGRWSAYLAAADAADAASAFHIPDQASGPTYDDELRAKPVARLVSRGPDAVQLACSSQKWRYQKVSVTEMVPQNPEGLNKPESAAASADANGPFGPVVNPKTPQEQGKKKPTPADYRKADRLDLAATIAADNSRLGDASPIAIRRRREATALRRGHRPPRTPLQKQTAAALRNAGRPMLVSEIIAITQRSDRGTREALQKLIKRGEVEAQPFEATRQHGAGARYAWHATETSDALDAATSEPQPMNPPPPVACDPSARPCRQTGRKVEHEGVH